jgi:hypothetical protein
VPRVVLYVADECGLCDEAREVVVDAQAEHGFELEIVDIAGDDELESRYRVELPVVEIDGERAFAYVVEPSALRDRLAVPPTKSGGTLAES